MPLHCGTGVASIPPMPATDHPEDLANRIRKRLRQTRGWARRAGISCFRIYERDLPDHPAVVDWYDGDAVCWTRPRRRDETATQDRAWQAAVQRAVAAACGIELQHVHCKRRERQRGEEQYRRLDTAGVVRVVPEGPLRYEVNLSDYLDTGLFLDHRPTRARVLAEADGLHVLNLFCYTGTFTCAAAVGGAASTTSVDLSRTYLAWTARNLGHNGIEPDATDQVHRCERADCLAWLTEAGAAGRRFDLVICDPPTFSNSNATSADLVIDRDWAALLQAVRGVCADGATVYFSTNFRRFAGDPCSLSGYQGEEISRISVPQDMRDRRIHRCWRLQVAA